MIIILFLIQILIHLKNISKIIFKKHLENTDKD